LAFRLDKRTTKGDSIPGASKGISGQAGLKNVEGKAQRRRQYECTARSCNAAIGIFSDSRLWPAVLALGFQDVGLKAGDFLLLPQKSPLRCAL